MRKRLTKKEKAEALELLALSYPDAKAELNYTTPFELLIATILSAQCTDVRVNIVTGDLFKTLKHPKDYLELGEDELGRRIKTCGLYKSKSKNIIKTCQQLIDCHGGQVPRSIEVMTTLPGVGKKTANVVASNAFGIPAIAVDTHVFRVSNRIGLVQEGTVEKTEEALMKVIPKNQWTKMHHVLIFHGRRCCNARKPNCDECGIKHVCLYHINGK
jgi:endonuclease-3